MAATKTNNVVLTSTSVAAGTTKFGAPSAAFDARAGYGGVITYQITNGATAPTGTPTITIQTSGDGSLWSDIFSDYGDNTSSSLTARSYPIDVGNMYIRALPWGHATAAVTFAVQFEQVVAF